MALRPHSSRPGLPPHIRTPAAAAPGPTLSPPGAEVDGHSGEARQCEHMQQLERGPDYRSAGGRGARRAAGGEARRGQTQQKSCQRTPPDASSNAHRCAPEREAPRREDFGRRKEKPSERTALGSDVCIDPHPDLPLPTAAVQHNASARQQSRSPCKRAWRQQHAINLSLWDEPLNSAALLLEPFGNASTT